MCMFIWTLRAFLKAPSGTEGVVIGKKVFQRAKKDKNAKTREKAAIEKLEKTHEQNEKALLEVLITKLQTLLNNKNSAGVTNNFGEMLIAKGGKFSNKNLITQLGVCKTPFLSNHLMQNWFCAHTLRQYRSGRC